VLEH
jgi:DNA-binding MarR family transcriptional regulator